ncbi:MAG TPA: flagellar biosynthetic protein FliO [Pirellulales bacterium]
MAASLAIVLGLFFVITWLMRRTLPNASRKLPSEVVDTLGRTPLAGRQQMHLLRFGNKLLLVCVSPAGVNTLAEISDPAEIDRVISLCGKAESSSANKSFKQILGQLAGDKLPQLSSDGNRKTSLPFSSRSSAVTGESADV